MSKKGKTGKTTPENLRELENHVSQQADPLDADELKLVLARAFDGAWARYYRPGRVTISADIARPVLANHLVKMARDGVADESKLAAGGVLRLISLAPEEPGNLSA